MKYILGVDAGNTKTIALVAHPNGKIVGWGRGGCGDIYNAGSPQLALQNLDEAVQAAFQMAGCTAADIVAAAFSMAGADWPEDFALIEAGLKKTSYGQNFVLVNDSIGALCAGAVEGWGVALANGTGAAISARSEEGLVWQAGWWQEGGGGRSLGNSALRAVYRSALGIDGETALTASILKFYGVTTVEELLHQFTRRLDPLPSNVPALGRLVLDVAHAGDATAAGIVQAEGLLLGDYILAAARKVGIEDKPFPLSLTGSIFKHHGGALIAAILERVQAKNAHVIVERSSLEPSAGALLMAMEKAGVSADLKIRARLKRTSPPLTFYKT